MADGESDTQGMHGGERGGDHVVLENGEADGSGPVGAKGGDGINVGGGEEGASGEWKKEAVEAGVKFAEDVWVMMQDPNQIEAAKINGTIDSMRRPEVIGVLVLLHAARAVMFGEGKDEGGKVAKYTERLLTVWAGFNMTFKEGDWNQANQILVMAAPVWSGMRMARRVLGKGSELEKELGVILAEMEPVLQNLRDTITTHQPKEDVRRGLNMYDELSKICS